MEENSPQSSFIIPSHLAETLRYKSYRWNKASHLKRLANEVVSQEKRNLSFLGIPLDSDDVVA